MKKILFVSSEAVPYVKTGGCLLYTSDAADEL